MSIPCGYCDLTFRDESSMIHHIEQVHDAEAHAQASSPLFYACEPCQGLRFATESDLQAHISRIHSASAHCPLPFSCSTCQATFPTQHSLLSHQSLFHPPPSTPWPCPDCPKSFRYKTRLVQHALVHIDKSQRSRNYDCSLCEKSFFRSADLWAHKKIHSGSRYTCDLCGKSLSSSGSLHNHRLMHKGKRFHCSICGLEFVYKQKFDNHRLQHEGKKPFECDECHMGFVHKQSWLAHLRIHGGDRLQCELCKKLFSDQSYLNKHMKWHKQVQERRQGDLTQI
ncbi:hypothetical protein TCAL_08036 [Tigriopus californicus]|uniref:C2H2-type domain-containing protein n=1 Tax=Tigriopus californicus TaxID=6832 RepID=A0A553NNB0_TIGCA|nr:zinc finger protein 154-like [Tigriopus californicus]TRY66928.1 hypothetical protein TCAL_08036 [Tigriopus californicus]|eukprot:TCALIF_08036-PA protein Name:"Similar to ZNF154 Zinc finger protein 154 (Homo sapiens)" AED:0.10 eAED:0.10 QI:0/-1/0/1/-1/1/1/0/281